MSFQVLNDVLPGVFVREYVCECVRVYANFLQDTALSWQSTLQPNSQKKCSLVKVSMLNFNNVFIPKWVADCTIMTQKNMQKL